VIPEASKRLRLLSALLTVAYQMKNVIWRGEQQRR
jgi:hypothetical protein